MGSPALELDGVFGAHGHIRARKGEVVGGSVGLLLAGVVGRAATAWAVEGPVGGLVAGGEHHGLVEEHVCVCEASQDRKGGGGDGGSC